MKHVISTLLALVTMGAMVAGGQTAIAADDRSPYDKNPACLDRNVDSNKEECLIKDDGTPRHTYPSRTTVVAPVKPAVAPATLAPPAAVVRKAPAASGR